jgi:hypothetical protein
LSKRHLNYLYHDIKKRLTLPDKDFKATESFTGIEIVKKFTVIKISIVTFALPKYFTSQSIFLNFKIKKINKNKID